MMAPDYAHWHGMFEVGERFYKEMVPQIREVIEKGEKNGKHAEAKVVRELLEKILKRPEHQWYSEGKPMLPADHGLKEGVLKPGAGTSPASAEQPAEETAPKTDSEPGTESKPDVDLTPTDEKPKELQ